MVNEESDLGITVSDDLKWDKQCTAAGVAPDIISGPGWIWPPDMRLDLTIFRCICLTVIGQEFTIEYSLMTVDSLINVKNCSLYKR